MKTTVQIPDTLLMEAKRIASNEKTTVRALIEEALRKTLADRAQETQFELEDRSVEGEGLQPGIEEGNWEQIRAMIYEGRGQGLREVPGS